MRLDAVLLCALAAVPFSSVRASAQTEKPPIGRFVLDVRATFPQFGSEQQLADSRGLRVSQLPGSGLGVDADAHVYVFRWKAITFGLGALVTFAQSHSSQSTSDDQPPVALPGVTERFSSVSPQISFNFGKADGWSYISGGIGVSAWTVIPDGGFARPPDMEHLQASNYGGGARWFLTPHIAFHVDVRFYGIYPGTPDPTAYPGSPDPTAQTQRPGSPRTTLLIVGTGVSIK
jgi:hypothetical protein